MLEKIGRKARREKTLEARISLEEAKEAASKALQAEATIKGLTEQRDAFLAQVLAYQLQTATIDLYFDQDWYHLTEAEAVELDQNGLKKRVPSPVWTQITDSVRVVNPLKVERALQKGRLAPEDLKVVLKVSVSVGARHQRPKVKAAKVA